MKEKTQEKTLIQVNENNIFYKIKKSFINLFNKATDINNNYVSIEETKISKESENEKSSFMEEIKNIEDEETRLLQLQKQYRTGKIKEEQLSQEQVNSLCDLYDRQIANLKKSNEIRKQKLLEYRETTN